MSEVIDFKALAAPFHPQDIEWRLQECGKKGDKIWAMCLAYITNRAIMQRLDDVCGPAYWKNEYRPGPQGGVICGISIKCGGEWVEKWDGADNTAVEATKGGLSDAMKRAGVQWGIGRYLYNLEVGFAEILPEGKKGEYRGKVKEGNIWFAWNPPKLPAWALPTDAPKQTTPQREAPPLPDAQPTQQPATTNDISPADAEYHKRITAALKAIYGDDKNAALAKVEEMTTFTPKGKTEPVKGVRNFLTLKGDRAKFLAEKLEKLVKASDAPPEKCDKCGLTLTKEGVCPDPDCTP
jgi:hypothetical protein